MRRGDSRTEAGLHAACMRLTGLLQAWVLGIGIDVDPITRDKRNLHTARNCMNQADGLR